MIKEVTSLVTKRRIIAKTDVIYEPAPLDVLCGRGRLFQNYSGNVKMREIVKKHKRQYSNAPHQEKFGIVIELVEMGKRSSKPPVRFLR